MPDRTLLNAAQVAIKLGHSAEWFVRNRADLEAGGFPPAAIGNGRGRRWDPHAINAWLDARMPANLRVTIDAGDPAFWQDELARRLDEGRPQ